MILINDLIDPSKTLQLLLQPEKGIWSQEEVCLPCEICGTKPFSEPHQVTLFISTLLSTLPPLLDVFPSILLLLVETMHLYPPLLSDRQQPVLMSLEQLQSEWAMGFELFLELVNIDE